MEGAKATNPLAGPSTLVQGVNLWFDWNINARIGNEADTK